jgi:hypothetical protein
MRTGKRRAAGLGVLLLLVGVTARAQDFVPPGGARQPASLPAVPLPVAQPGLTPVTPPPPLTPMPPPPVMPPALTPGEKLPVAVPLDQHGPGNGHEANGHEANGHEANGHDHEGHGLDSHCCTEGEGHWGGGLFFTGDYLFLQPRRQAQDFAILGGPQFALPNGTVQSVNWDSQSGFRLGAGYRMADGWEISTEWTYFHSRGQNVLGVPTGGGGLFATLTRAGTVDDVDTAAATANLNYSIIDLVAGKHVHAGEDLDLRVFGGGLFGMIDQKLDALYNGGSSGALNDRVSSPVYFRGAGLEAGAEGTWHVYKGFGLYGLAKGALVSGQFRDQLTQTVANNTGVVVDVREKYYQVVPMMMMGAGFSVELEHVWIKFGYELTNWFDMVRSPDFSDGTSIGHVSHRYSDLSLEGLRVQLGLVF